jgi:shikimate kinase
MSDSDRRRTPVRVRGVALVGFMGAGKSTVGKLLAARLGWEFLDLDECITQASGRSIAAMFAAEGETRFREQEDAALVRVLEEAGRPVVLALGGGAWVQRNNVRRLQSAGYVAFFLDVPVNELWRRCREEPIARLLAQDFAGFSQLYAQRRVAYLNGTTRVPAERTGDEVAMEIELRLQDLPATPEVENGS